jgi:hypothetical protein
MRNIARFDVDVDINFRIEAETTTEVSQKVRERLTSGDFEIKSLKIYRDD